MLKVDQIMERVDFAIREMGGALISRQIRGVVQVMVELFNEECSPRKRNASTAKRKRGHSTNNKR